MLSYYLVECLIPILYVLKLITKCESWSWLNLMPCLQDGMERNGVELNGMSENKNGDGNAMTMG